MPIYEFGCEKCGEMFEYLARTLADRPGKCPACGSKKIAKRLSSFSPAAAVPKACGSCEGAPSCPSMRAGGCGHACAGMC